VPRGYYSSRFVDVVGKYVEWFAGDKVWRGKVLESSYQQRQIIPQPDGSYTEIPGGFVVLVEYSEGLTELWSLSLTPVAGGAWDGDVYRPRYQSRVNG
jgi:hypothetical protein